MVTFHKYIHKYYPIVHKFHLLQDRFQVYDHLLIINNKLLLIPAQFELLLKFKILLPFLKNNLQRDLVYLV